MNGMPSLREHPGFLLTLFFVFWVTAFVTYSSGIYQHICTGQSHQPCCFRIPLIPAYKYSQAANRGVNRLKAQIARGKVKFLIIGRVIRNMHFAIFAGYRTVFFEYNRGIVIKSCSTLFKKRAYYYYSMLLGKIRKFRT